MGITAPGLAHGFIVVYTDWLQPDPGNLSRAAEVPTAIEKLWCIDPARIYLTGHSDGATIADDVPVLLASPRVAAVAPYAGGPNPPPDTPCPVQSPLSAMVMHSVNDTVFPGAGLAMRDYYARCEGCDTTKATNLPSGCVEYAQCKAGAIVRYCQTTGQHADWPTQVVEPMLEFFLTR
jgi:polyhydroxybutyrate depolymerase